MTDTTGTEENKPHGNLAGRILVGLLVGAVAGSLLNWKFAPAAGAAASPEYERVRWFADNVASPVGQVFLRMLFMVVVPLVFCSLFLGVSGLGDLRKLGKIGARTLAWFGITTGLAVVLGLVLMNTFEPGKKIDRAKAEEIRKEFKGEADKKVEAAKEGTGFGISTFVNIVPKNVVRSAADDRDTLGLIFFALILGAAATAFAPERIKPFVDVCQILYDLCVKVLGYAMKLAPYGVAGLVFNVTSKLGIDVLVALGYYVLVAMFGLALHQYLVLGLLARWFGGWPIADFFRRIKVLTVTAFSTSSSNATLPTTINTAVNEFNVPKPIAGFVLPLGATMNMNGTALFEGAVVLFLAQVAGIELSLGSQAVVVCLAVLTAIGAAGVPGGSLPLLALVLTQVGIPADMLALILGVDRLVDMARTVPNVTSDLVCAMWVAKKERAEKA